MVWLEGKHEYELEGDQWDDRRQFLMKALEQVVGILSERSPGTYSFLHLTFQEYLAGVSLLLPKHSVGFASNGRLNASAEEVVNNIIDNAYLSDPKWRQ